MAMLAVPLLMGSALAEGEVREATVAEAGRLIEGGAQLLDVRTAEEWDEGHIEGATRIGIAGDDFAARVAEAFDRSKPVVVYCRSGNRSARAAAQLEKLGFVAIHDLKGGIKAWKAAGRPVVK